MSGICPVRCNRTTCARHRRDPEIINTADALTSAPTINKSRPRLVRMLGLGVPPLGEGRIGTDAMALCACQAPDASAADRTCDALRRCAASGDEAIQRAERPYSRESHEVEAGHTAFEPVAEDGNRRVGRDFGPEGRMNHRQFVQVYGVAGR